MLTVKIYASVSIMTVNRIIPMNLPNVIYKISKNFGKLKKNKKRSLELCSGEKSVDE